jgi:NAD(P)-dependent dehydrogenase (short-subunit alcohol dehydrogenase family)
MRKELTFEDRVVIVTGAGNGLGKDYALKFANLGAKVVVNDVSEQAATMVVDEIKFSDGEAIANFDDVAEGGPKIV